MEQTFLAALDAVEAQIRTKRPGARVTRADVIRELLGEAIGARGIAIAAGAK